LADTPFLEIEKRYIASNHTMSEVEDFLKIVSARGWSWCPVVE
jgi:hypothetical protein